MEEVYVVRHRHLVGGIPIRRLAREMGISKNTIKRYLRGAPPGVGKPRGVPGAPVRDVSRGGPGDRTRGGQTDRGCPQVAVAATSVFPGSVKGPPN